VKQVFWTANIIAIRNKQTTLELQQLLCGFYVSWCSPDQRRRYTGQGQLLKSVQESAQQSLCKKIQLLLDVCCQVRVAQHGEEQ
jgi:hypothetical protein